MKVIGVSTKKSIEDGTGVHRVTVKYVIGTRGQKVNTAHLLYDWLGDTVRFADSEGQAANRIAADALFDFTKAYFRLNLRERDVLRMNMAFYVKFYGWEE